MRYKVGVTGKPPEPEVLAKCDACYLFPCQNGGTCQTRPLRQFECLCAPGFHGPHCEYVIDACFGKPCENGGTCKVLEAGRFRTNFYSLTAMIKIMGESGLSVVNPPSKMQFTVQSVMYSFSRHLMLSSMYVHVVVYSCHCPVGFEGDRCEVNIDDCFENKCEHNSTCVDLVQEYSCQCTPGYTGESLRYL
ncbi:SLIT2 [Cordylochernes scorpioides]|uniref:SLIT2 n=1 Tax=Cordylochernes scorpioides TaxID=51811 RepID=A0ABY6LH91_9ARAC|nr:SLIT2 [Cordylochernes scorpioides]